MALCWPALYGNCPVLIEALDLGRDRLQRSTGYLLERNRRRVLAREDIQASQLRELGPLLHSQTAKNWNLLVTFSQHSRLHPVERGVNRLRDICVGDMRKVCPIYIYVDHVLDAWLSPIISHSGRNRDVKKDLLQLLGLVPELRKIF